MFHGFEQRHECIFWSCHSLILELGFKKISQCYLNENSILAHQTKICRSKGSYYTMDLTYFMWFDKINVKRKMKRSLIENSNFYIEK